jgi:hypothetical protein
VPSVFDTPALWTDWALPKASAYELVAWLDRHRPTTVVEAGSGVTTVLLAEHAHRTGATVVSLEHQPRFADQTRRLLDEHGLRGRVDLRVAPLTEIDTPDGPARWYDTALPDRVDFALLDGPPGAIGRAGGAYRLAPHLNPNGWTVWLDDADRDAEQAALAAWSTHLGWHSRRVGLPRGTAICTPTPSPPDTVDASDVAITILTGLRPGLLASTVASVQNTAPGLLDSAHVTVMHNGADPATAALLDGYDWIDRRIVTAGPQVPHGPATSALFADLPDRPYLLHLEDDWASVTLHDGWLNTARAVLADNRRVGQVRLRHRGDRVLPRHMVTGKPIVWQPHHIGGVSTAVAHWTLNPSLMRTAEVGALWPAADEGQAMRRFAASGALSVQLDPGVFTHLGGSESLHPGRRYPQ